MAPETLTAAFSDTFGETHTRSVTVELYGGGQIVKFVLDDGSSWVFEGGELRAALEPRREIREQAA